MAKVASALHFCSCVLLSLQICSLFNIAESSLSSSSPDNVLGEDWTGVVEFYSIRESPRCDYSSLPLSHSYNVDELPYRSYEITGVEEVIGKAFIFETPLFSTQSTKYNFKHAYVLLETKSWWWTIEKNTKTIVIQRSKCPEDVRDRLKQKRRTTGLTKLAETSMKVADETRNVKMSELIYYLWKNQEQNKQYDLFRRNCQFFSQTVFNYVSKSKAYSFFLDDMKKNPVSALLENFRISFMSLWITALIGLYHYTIGQIYMPCNYFNVLGMKDFEAHDIHPFLIFFLNHLFYTCIILGVMSLILYLVFCIMKPVLRVYVLRVFRPFSHEERIIGMAFSFISFTCIVCIICIVYFMGVGVIPIYVSYTKSPNQWLILNPSLDCK